MRSVTKQREGLGELEESTYHRVIMNCTMSIYGQQYHRIPRDWRILVTGQLDGAQYDRNRLDQTRPSKDLKRDGLGDYIRHELRELRND